MISPFENQNCEVFNLNIEQLLVIGSLNTYNFLTDWQRSTYSSYYSYIHIPCMEDSVSTYCIPLAEHCKTHITTVKHTAPAINTFKFQGSFLGLEKWWRNGLAGKSPCCSFQVSASAWRNTTTFSFRVSDFLFWPLPGTHMVYMHADRQTYTIKTNESFYKIKTILHLTFSVIFNQNKYKL